MTRDKCRAAPRAGSENYSCMGQRTQGWRSGVRGVGWEGKWSLFIADAEHYRHMQTHKLTVSRRNPKSNMEL